MTYTGKLVNAIVQAADAKNTNACCARCCKPMPGDERLKVGRFTYGTCCMAKVQEEQSR
jgi:hypothetical protein